MIIKKKLLRYNHGHTVEDLNNYTNIFIDLNSLLYCTKLFTFKPSLYQCAYLLECQECDVNKAVHYATGLTFLDYIEVLCALDALAMLQRVESEKKNTSEILRNSGASRPVVESICKRFNGFNIEALRESLTLSKSTLKRHGRNDLKVLNHSARIYRYNTDLLNSIPEK